MGAPAAVREQERRDDGVARPEPDRREEAVPRPVWAWGALDALAAAVWNGPTNAFLSAFAVELGAGGAQLGLLLALNTLLANGLQLHGAQWTRRGRTSWRVYGSAALARGTWLLAGLIPAAVAASGRRPLALGIFLALLVVAGVATAAANAAMSARGAAAGGRHATKYLADRMTATWLGTLLGTAGMNALLAVRPGAFGYAVGFAAAGAIGLAGLGAYTALLRAAVPAAPAPRPPLSPAAETLGGEAGGHEAQHEPGANGVAARGGAPMPAAAGGSAGPPGNARAAAGGDAPVAAIAVGSAARAVAAEERARTGAAAPEAGAEGETVSVEDHPDHPRPALRLAAALGPMRRAARAARARGWPRLRRRVVDVHVMERKHRSWWWRRVARRLGAPDRRALGDLVLGAAILQGGAAMVGPASSIWLAHYLHTPSSFLGTVSLAGSAGAIVSQRLWARWIDRAGADRVLAAGGATAALIPLGWMLVWQPWIALAVSAFGGVAWGGYTLAMTARLVKMAPEAERPAYMGTYSAAVGAASAAGSLIAGGITAIVPVPWIPVVFLLSFLSRGLGWLVLRPTRAGSTHDDLLST